MPTVGELFAGVGGLGMGFERAGFRIAWQCEIDPSARGVLNYHWPAVPKFEDVRGVGVKNLEPVDVLVGGFPCTDLSTAGRRAGINAGTRSGLWWEMHRVIKELKPSWVVFENVPGLLSGYDEEQLDGTEDCPERGADGVEAGDVVRRWWMGSVLSSLSDIGYVGAYRILDAQHFGVPQRRRRVFGVFARHAVVGAGAVRAGEILALGEGVPGHPAKGGEAGAGVAAPLTASDGRRRGSPDGGDTKGHLVAGFTEPGEGHATYQGTETAGSIRTNSGGGGTKANLVVAFGGGQCVGGARGTSPALTAHAGRQDFDTELFVIQDATGRGHERNTCQPVALAENSRDELRTSDVAPALQQPGGRPGHGFAATFVPDVSQPIRSNVFNNSDPAMEATMHVAPAGTVRRLMPVECERLQGWPDAHTQFAAFRRTGKKPRKGTVRTETRDGELWDIVEQADGPRYRQCGNGVATPCATFVARRLRTVIEQLTLEPTP